MNESEPTIGTPKILVVFYSLTGSTERIANEIVHVFDYPCDIERIVERRARQGWWGHLRSIYEVIRKKRPPINQIKANIQNYDLVILGSPVWASCIASPARTFLHANRTKIRKIAFFCTLGGSGANKAIDDMTLVYGDAPAATLDVTTAELGAGSYYEKLNEFVAFLEWPWAQAEECEFDDLPGAVRHSTNIISLAEELSKNLHPSNQSL